MKVEEKGTGDGTKGTGNVKQVISATDKAKIFSWKYPTNDELYLKHKHVFDNPKYYDQETGAINWPKNDGFLNTPIEETLQPGFRIDRFGCDTGIFVSLEGTPYGMRAVAPGTDLRSYNVFDVIAPIKVKGGEFAPWFDEVGGGVQYVLTDSVENLLEQGMIRRVTP
ncbi:TNT domain-containing protein [Bacillus weihaiensis]|uniref:TNT domain-containing protein n=1 Tax=Bacillus weihaiensis TaxID=1547283 RepID=A0A1L3MN93_9BACI|nr:TNT domain-containing protein [Bacillus weihaiensis]APH03820.1 hypothetical protein A9C19_03065 [Bacillus weihaiensis]